VRFRGGPFERRSLAPFNEVRGEYRTWIAPFDRPVTIYVIKLSARVIQTYEWLRAPD
jgi:hypothetical protein